MVYLYNRILHNNKKTKALLIDAIAWMNLKYIMLVKEASWGWGSVVEHLPGLDKALGSNPRTAKKTWTY
jgi:hypothetical protein